MFRRKRNGQCGECLIELALASMILVPIALFGIDLTSLVVTHEINDNLAKNVARAAANQKSIDDARKAAATVIKQLPTSALLIHARLLDFTYTESSHQVSVKTEVDVRVPAPFPYFASATLVSQATEATVGQAAEL
jgi:hypothetical protein